MEQISSPIFQALFQTHHPKIILYGDLPDYTIIDYNQAFELLTKPQYNYRGKSFLDAYNTSFVNFNSTEVTDGFLVALNTRNVVLLAPFLSEAPSVSKHDTKQIWLQFEILAVEGKDGNPAYLVLSVNDISAVERLKLREQDLGDKLAASYEELSSSNEELDTTLAELSLANQRLLDLNAGLESKIIDRVKQLAERESSLRSLVMSAHYPLMILRGREWVIEIANQPLVNLWDKTLEQVTGNQLMTILPEIEDQPFPGFLRQVYDTGVGYGQEEQVFYYNSPSGPAEKYVSFYYDPMFDELGEVCGIIVAADDITSKVKQRKELQEALHKEQLMAKQIADVNDELSATIEELTASNEELEESRQELLRHHTQLIASEQRFRLLISQAPVGICVIRASDLMIEAVNDGYMELVGKTKEEFENRTIWEAVAEAADSYAPIMSSVVHTAAPFVGKEHQLKLIRKGKVETVFVDFVYEPVVLDGIVVSIMVVAIEVTDKVKARRAVEEVEQRVRLAVEAAEMGTFEFSYLDNSIVTSPRFDMLFGVFNPSKRQDLLRAFHPDDLHLSAQAHEAARRSGHMLYETRLIKSNGHITWIRIQGKVFYTNEGKPEKLLGTIVDITDFKKLQQQKDDFISIASHELKTPITSLKASLQLLQRQKDRGNLELMPRLIDQAGKSMDKISVLIEDLLNVSRMNAGSMPIKKTEFQIQTLLDDCCTNLQENTVGALAFEGDVTLNIFADKDRIEQVVTNFLNNAIKYAPNSEVIKISVLKELKTVKISVTDQGPGIAQENIPHLFDRYYRADESGQQVSGLGLGLYICADIIQRHGGDIGVESELGVGSSFWFSLPLEVESGLFTD
jgi:PAS domain S-box-containing protein